ncbi:phosphoribosyltransferase family protein [Acaryochloris sp. IP29b_bin.137]|uniref:phosphoribosyltransferase n=1 Tax=Acaryochloris sp. IP29b_bin.137 TaxID=2969217 RepID=UPI0026275099|nr:phosphoribosyltransferase family protein [Acaryochloris sp. IP29b_bin.137]
MADLYVSWSEYHQQIEQLAALIYQSGWQFNQIICLARGGLRVGDVLSRIYQQPLAILATSSYGGTNGQERHQWTASQEMTFTTHLGNRILLVDDLVDSGITLEQTLIWLKQRYGPDIEDIRTAVLWYKACSKIEPHFFVKYLAENPWIHQPFESYEAIDIEALSQKYAAIDLSTPRASCS